MVSSAREPPSSSIRIATKLTVNSSEVVRDSIKALRHHQVYSILREWIFDGTYPAGAKLPSEGDLCDRLGVSRITSRQALDLLVREGPVRRVRGQGPFVAIGWGEVR